MTPYVSPSRSNWSARAASSVVGELRRRRLLGLDGGTAIGGEGCSDCDALDVV